MNAYREMLQSADYKAAVKKGSLGAVWTGPKRSKEILDEGFQTMKQYADTYDK